MSRTKGRILLLALPLLIGCIYLLGCPSTRLALLERITGNTPTARAGAYIEAVLRGDEEVALAIWELPSPRHWVLRDVYPRGQEPLFWHMLYEPKVHYLD